MRTRLFPFSVAVLLISLPATLLLATPGQARTTSGNKSSTADGTGVTTRTLHFDTVVGPNDSTHCDVVGELHRPAGATRTDPVPAILTTNAFSGSYNDPVQSGLARSLARRGYAVLSYSGLGFGGSGCRISLNDPEWDGKVGRQLVSFLGGSRAARDGTIVDFVRRDATAHDGRAYADDPRVGMLGISYGGGAQFAVASVDPRVDTIVPIITWNSLVYALAPNNAGSRDGVPTDVPGVYKKAWSDMFLALGITAGLFNLFVDPSRLAGCPNFVTEVCQARAQLGRDGYPSTETIASVRRVSVASRLHLIRVPTLLIQGQQDSLFNLQEAVATYRGLKARGVPVQMIWQSWGHSGGILNPRQGELNLLAGRLEGTYQGDRMLAWYDHYLRGTGTGPGPEFAYYRDWVPADGESREAYAEVRAYPTGGTRKLYLSGSDDLVGSEDRVEPGSVTYRNWIWGVPTNHSETPGIDGLLLPGGLVAPFDMPGTHAAYTSAPLSGDLDVVGSPRLSLAVRSDSARRADPDQYGRRLMMFVKLYDVAPNGSATLRNRMISPVRVPKLDEPFTVELPAIVHRFRAGHRLRLVVAGSDTAYSNNNSVHDVTIRTGVRDEQVLTLPTAGG